MSSPAPRASVDVRPAGSGEARARQGAFGFSAQLHMRLGLRLGMLLGLLLGVGALTGCTTSLLRGADRAAAETDTPPDPGGELVDSGEEDDGASTSGTDTTPSDPCQSFLGCADFPEPLPMCDHWAQDCEAGEKCTAVASTPGSGAWDANVCVPAGTAGIGDPCTRADGPLGTDTCNEVSMCFDHDPDTGVGTCVGFCLGPRGAPTCPEASGPLAKCRLTGSGVLNICPPDCNPLLSGACPSGSNCTAAFEGQELGGFICFPPGTPTPGVSGEACSCANCCAAQHMCVAAADYGLGCAHDGCCTEYCDVDDPSFECQGADQLCIPLFPPDTPELGHVGRCIVP